MSKVDPAAVIATVGLWAAELRERGQLNTDGAEARLTSAMTELFGERLDRQDDPLLVVMLCGPTAAGKSSLINALAGADISAPGLGATTRAAVLYMHEQDDPTRLLEYSIALGSNETELIRHGRDELLHKVLVDTPDIDSVRLQHKELTGRLVHAADLVLFVTSPEKYKVMRSARWVLEQRQQRALAFVLNKWDSQALGVQHDRRHQVEKDFRNVLAGEGFPDALVFKVSALTNPCQDRHQIENELPALRAWLETGISQSTAATIQRRRIRAAWGRLAAAIEKAAPRCLSSHSRLNEFYERLARGGGTLEQGVMAEASILEPVGLEDGHWPSTPGLLGIWTRTLHRLASLRTAFALLNGRARNSGGDPSHRSTSGAAFGARSVAALTETIAHIASEAAAEHMALGPVTASWTAETTNLEQQLSLLPLDVAAELAARANRPTLRRFVGTAWVYAIEGLIILVLLVTIGRVGADFVAGSYAPEGLFGSAVALVLILLILGHTIAAMFFPPLRQRMRRTVAQRAKSCVNAATERARTALRQHVDAVDRLARQGSELRRQIDHMVIALATAPTDGTSVDRLFGEPPPQLRLTAEANPRSSTLMSETEELKRRRPSFD